MSSTRRPNTQDTAFRVGEPSIWTEERTKKLLALHAGKWSASQIAAELGVSKNAVIGKLDRLGKDTGKAKMPNRAKRYGKPPPRPDRKTPFRKPKPQPAPERQRDSEGVLAPDDIRRFETPSDGRGITLLELNNDTCRWPKGDVGEPDFAFCGDAANLSDGRPYCHHHMRMRVR